MVGVKVRLPTPRYNIAPTDTIPLLRDGALDYARWWLTPSWAPEVSTKYSMFNAKAENLAKSRAFRQPFKCQRGIVPMSSFLEWRTEGGSKQPWLITNDTHTLAVAALWDVWQGGDTPLLSCALVTTKAAPEFTPWHSRMPVILAGDEMARWMDNSQEIPPDDPLFRPELKFPLSLYPVDRAAGNSRNKNPQLVEPTGPEVHIFPSEKGGGKRGQIEE